MSIKLTTFDVTIGRLKVTFGMWNLSKIFLTIKCASSVRITWNELEQSLEGHLHDPPMESDGRNVAEESRRRAHC